MDARSVQSAAKTIADARFSVTNLYEVVFCNLKVYDSANRQKKTLNSLQHHLSTWTHGMPPMWNCPVLLIISITKMYVLTALTSIFLVSPVYGCRSIFCRSFLQRSPSNAFFMVWGKVGLSVESHRKGSVSSYNFRRRFRCKYKLGINYLTEFSESFMLILTLECCSFVQCPFCRFLEFWPLIGCSADWTSLFAVAAENCRSCLEVASSDYSGNSKYLNWY